MEWTFRHKLDGLLFLIVVLCIVTAPLCRPSKVSFPHINTATALKCHDCTSWEGGVVNFKPGCDSHPDTGAMKGQLCVIKDGFTGCLEVWGYMGDMSRTLVVRGGYYNKQVEGRVPSCYHPNQQLVVEVHVEVIRFDYITYCHVCDDLDGCNGAFSWNKAKTILTLVSILVLLLT